MLDFEITGNNAFCPGCKSHLTSLLLCPECGIRYPLSMVLGSEIIAITLKDGVSLPDGIGDYLGRTVLQAIENLFSDQEAESDDISNILSLIEK